MRSLVGDAPLRPGECVCPRCEAEQKREEGDPIPAQLLPGPSRLTHWPRSHLRGAPSPAHLPLAAHRLLTGANYFSAAFQTRAWDLYFSSKINILKAVFSHTVQARGVFNYLRKAFLGQANLFTVSLVGLFVLWSWPINQLLGVYCIILSRK